VGIFGNAMKIFILKVSEAAMPRQQRFVYPRHNRDFGVEQDFMEFLLRNPDVVTSDSARADWHYLPVFWTRWHLNHEYGKSGLEVLQACVDNALLDDRRTFTVCQYDDGPLVKLGGSKVFLSSRKTAEGLDAPLLCERHRRPWITPRKRYLASFVGRLQTHNSRIEMAAALTGRADILIQDGGGSSRRFVKTVLRSHAALAPRGYGGSSFRFYEAMELGVAPILIGDVDTRPFKQDLPWSDASLYVSDARELGRILDAYTLAEWDRMGRAAAELFERALTYQKWCPFVLQELKRLSS
jgi:hypothetical protein